MKIDPEVITKVAAVGFIFYWIPASIGLLLWAEYKAKKEIKHGLKNENNSGKVK